MAISMNADQLYVFCSDLMSRLEIRPPLTPALLCGRLGEYRGRPIKLQAADLGATTSIGHLVAQSDKDRILYERAAPSGQQATVIYHEVIHLIRDHLDGQTSLTCGELSSETAGSATANLYSTWQEREAETGAVILLKLSRRRLRPDHIATPGRHAEHRMAAAFGLTQTEWS